MPARGTELSSSRAIKSERTTVPAQEGSTLSLRASSNWSGCEPFKLAVGVQVPVPVPRLVRLVA